MAESRPLADGDVWRERVGPQGALLLHGEEAATGEEAPSPRSGAALPVLQEHPNFSPSDWLVPTCAALSLVEPVTRPLAAPWIDNGGNVQWWERQELRLRGGDSRAEWSCHPDKRTHGE